MTARSFENWDWRRDLARKERAAARAAPAPDERLEAAQRLAVDLGAKLDATQKVAIARGAELIAANDRIAALERENGELRTRPVAATPPAAGGPLGFTLARDAYDYAHMLAVRRGKSIDAVIADMLRASRKLGGERP